MLARLVVVVCGTENLSCKIFPNQQELTIAPTPRLRCANSTTIWLEWERPTVDARGKPPDRRVEYTLYMSGGFREWEVGDEVLAEYMSRAQRKAATSNSSTTTCSLTDAGSLAGGSLNEGAMSSVAPGGGGDKSLDQGCHDQVFSTDDEESAQSSAGHHSLPKLLPAVITGTASAADGLFDIRWNDGERERGVRRSRIHRAASPRPPWTIIYQGGECRYAVEGMVPESIIERERNFPYEVRGLVSAIGLDCVDSTAVALFCRRSKYMQLIRRLSVPCLAYRCTPTSRCRQGERKCRGKSLVDIVPWSPFRPTS